MDDPLAHLGGGRDPQILDVLLNFSPGPRRIFAQQLVELADLLVDPGPVNPYGRGHLRATKSLELLAQLAQTLLADTDLLAEPRG